VIETVTGDLDDLVRIVKAIGGMEEAAVFRMRPG
jgi:hypothetical protein